MNQVGEDFVELERKIRYKGIEYDLVFELTIDGDDYRLYSKPRLYTVDGDYAPVSVFKACKDSIDEIIAMDEIMYSEELQDYNAKGKQYAISLEELNREYLRGVL